MKSIEEKIVLSKDDCNFLIDYFESSLSRKYTKSSQYKKGGVHAIVDYSHIPKDFFEKLKEPQILIKIYQVESNLCKIDKQVLYSFYELKNKVLKNKNDEGRKYITQSKSILKYSIRRC
jgi:hypothetical protein